MPGCEGEDSDAVGAYTQVSLDEETLKELVGEGVFVDTWVALPRNRWPKDKNGKCLWDGINMPYVRLMRNLYGHKLAGLLWQKYSELKIKELGFEKVLGWECLYYNREWKVFLSIYVDDLKAAGPRKGLDLLWAGLGER